MLRCSLTTSSMSCNSVDALIPLSFDKFLTWNCVTVNETLLFYRTKYVLDTNYVFKLYFIPQYHTLLVSFSQFYKWIQIQGLLSMPSCLALAQFHCTSTVNMYADYVITQVNINFDYTCNIDIQFTCRVSNSSHSITIADIL